MNRTDKKCLIATTGFHLLLIVILFVGPGFFASKPKPDDMLLLDVIPANLIDAQLKSGVLNAQPAPPMPTPPMPQPPVPQPPQPKPPAPTPEPPQPVVKPEPVKPPDPEPPPPPERLKPDELTPVEKPKKPPKHEIKVDLTQKIVRRNPPKPVDTSAEDAAREEAKADKAAKAKARAFARSLQSIKSNATTATVVDMPGTSSAAYASYKDALASLYYDAWNPPDDIANDDAITKVSITIARDGTVISAHIVGASGDARMDASVRKAIDRVASVPPLPEGSKENQRTVILNFNLKAKRMIG